MTGAATAAVTTPATTAPHNDMEPLESVDVYFRRMARVPLLTREGEVELAQRIELGERTMLEALVDSAVAAEEFSRIAEEVKNGRLRVRDLVRNVDDEEAQNPETALRVSKTFTKVQKYQDNLLVAGARASKIDKAKLVRERDKIVADLPTVAVQDLQQFVEAQTGPINTFLYIVYGLLALAIIYAVCPDVEHDWRWVTPGSVVAVLLWMGLSLGFKAYVDHFGNYNAAYGSIAGVIVLMLWLYLTGVVILLGGEINAQIERAALALRSFSEQSSHPA